MPEVKTLILKWNMTIGYVKELDYKEKDHPEQLNKSAKITPTPPPKHLLLQYGKS